MGVLDWILVVIRWGHAVAAVAWVGGGVFYLMVLRPAIRRSQGLPPETGAAIRDEFRSLVTTAIAVLLLTGVILSVARLTSAAATVPYAVVLGVKIALALYMFYVVRIVRRGDYAEQQDSDVNRLRRADQQSKQSDGTSGHWHRCHRVVGCAGCTHRGCTGVLTIPRSRERVRT